MQDVAPWTQGETLLPLAHGETRTTPVAIEYAAEASYAPMVSLRSGPYKFNRCALDPDQLFDLENDPHELVNLIDDPEFDDIRAEFSALADAKWDLRVLMKRCADRRRGVGLSMRPCAMVNITLGIISR